LATVSELKDLAAKTYNRAFELIVEGDETEIAEGLELAATSLHLWRQVGTEQNWAIGLWLYARALHKAGAQALAIQHALESVQLAEQLGTDWLIASGYEGLARVSQGTPEFESRRASAEQAIKNIAGAEDRELIESQFADLR
jgi:hypothetical protein